MRISPRSLVVAGILASSLALAGCAPAAAPAADSSPSAPSEAFNDQDVAFVEGMLPHHQQAVEMSDMLIATEGVDPAVLQLAETITSAQQPEITTMTGWLDDWGVTTGMSGMDHGSGGMSGLMTDDDMASLDAATGVEASKLFLEQMTVHHSGAIEMAQVQIEDGQNPAVVELAQSIVDSQQAEIDEMTQILATL